jgi:hypothetical protein
MNWETSVIIDEAGQFSLVARDSHLIPFNYPPTVQRIPNISPNALLSHTDHDSSACLSTHSNHLRHTPHPDVTCNLVLSI